MELWPFPHTSEASHLNLALYVLPPLMHVIGAATYWNIIKLKWATHEKILVQSQAYYKGFMLGLQVVTLSFYVRNLD